MVCKMALDVKDCTTEAESPECMAANICCTACTTSAESLCARTALVEMQKRVAARKNIFITGFFGKVIDIGAGMNTSNYLKGLFYIGGICMSLAACSKKSVPVSKPEVSGKTTVVSKPKTAVVKTPVPAVIAVNDKVARKSVDGRLYYDLEGKRYWKNYQDGKYYLYNKSMHTNDAFRPPKS